MTRLSRILALAAALGVGFLLGRLSPDTAYAQAPSGTAIRPAYLIAATRSIEPDKLGPYLAVAGPLARAAGLSMVASGDPSAHVLEGSWPFSGRLSVERYTSMDALLKFWNSPEYQEAKKIRQAYSETHFIVAIDGAGVQ